MNTERLLIGEERANSEADLKKFTSELNFDNPFLFVRTGLIAKLFFYKEIYEKIINVPGNILEVGCWYGQSSIMFENIRSIMEHFNFTRKIVSFDTFDGYREKSGLKISDAEVEKYLVENDWLVSLEKLQGIHKIINASHTQFLNIKGDITKTIPEYLEKNHEPIALIYYDIATYDTVKFTFNNLMPRLSRGGIFVFDDYGYQYEGISKFITENGLSQKYNLVHSEHYKNKIYLVSE